MPVVRRDRRPAVLKIQWPDRESEHEADALAAWNGNGAIRLLEWDPVRRALLVERCLPGTPLSQIDPQKALEILVGLLARLWIPAPPALRSLRDKVAEWADTLPAEWERAGRPVERRLIDAALAAMHELVATHGPEVLVHQDLHAENVLRAEREPWLVIDPKPLRAEREFGIASIVRGAELGHSREAVLDRLDRLCEALHLDRERARRWTIAQTLAWTTFGADDLSARHIDVARWLLDT